jgi:DnaJ-class molecular chaperone
MKDAYETLGVSKTASQDEIKSAYRSLAKKFHPDLNPGNKEREARFKEISAAYEKVGEPEARKKYDRGETDEMGAGPGAAGASAYGGFGGGPFYYETQGGEAGGRYSNFSFGGGADNDFFENLFRQAGQGGRSRSGDAPGEDQLYQMEISFRDAVLGAERELTLPGGKKLHVVIPPGVDTGSRLRFRGQGGPGFGKGPAGDAYVEVSVRPLEGFTRKGKDLETEVPISFLEALRGGEVEVPTVEGKVQLKVPPGLSSGSRLRVKGKGVAGKGGERGDQYVVLKVVMPKKISTELAEAVRAWGSKFDYNPRSDA